LDYISSAKSLPNITCINFYICGITWCQ